MNSQEMQARMKIVLPTFVLATACLLSGQASSAADARLAEFRRAEQAFSERRFGEAAEGHERLARVSPDSVEIHAKLGLSRLYERKCDQAVPAFRKALELRPGIATAEVLLSICLSEMGRFAEALPALEKGFQNPPKYEGMKRIVGLELQRSYLGLEKYAKAARVTGELHVAYPDDPEVLFHANRAYRELALQSVEQLTRVAPSSVWVHEVMGENYFSREFYDLAITEYKKALAKDPKRAGLHFRVGQAMLGRAEDPSKADDALEQFELELKNNPNHAPAAFQAGEIYRRRLLPGEALPYFEQAVRLRPKFEEGLLALGRVLMELERPADAKQYLEQAVASNGENATSRYLLARVYRRLGDREGRREQLRVYRRLQAERRDLDQSILSGGRPEQVDSAQKTKSEGP